MKKILSFFCVLLIIAAVLPFGAFAADGVTVKFDENPSFSITADGIQTKYYSGNLGYGDFYALYFDAGAKITFNAETEFYNMGASQGKISAGTVKNISDIDGWYIYLGAATASTYVAFAGPTSIAGNYATLTPDRDLTDSIPGGSVTPSEPPAPPPPPALPPVPDGTPAELAGTYYVGQWPLPDGMYDPALDGIGVPNGAEVFGLFDAAYATLTPPASVKGFSKVATPAEVVNGTYCVHDGSSGFSYVILGTGSIAEPKPTAPATANPTASTVLVNGKETAFEAYNIGGNNFFKLRDLAMVLNGTAKQFEIGYDSATKAITMTSGKTYTPEGKEMAKGDGKSKTAKPTASRIFLDGKELDLTVYNIGGSNFFKLRDLMKAVNVFVDLNSAGALTIDTSRGYGG